MFQNMKQKFMGHPIGLKFINSLKNNKGFIVLIILLISLRWSFVDHYRVPTGSMVPTIAVGDMVLVNKLAYNFRLPFTDWILFETSPLERGDIVVFKNPQDTSMNFVKRLIGLPGDELEVTDGVIRINGKETILAIGTGPAIMEQLYNTLDTFHYEEDIDGKKFTVQRIPSAFQEASRRDQYPHYQKITVPKDHFFFMGDNRDNSADSRYWGFVPKDYIKGRAFRVTLSITFGDYYLPHFEFSRFGQQLI